MTTMILSSDYFIVLDAGLTRNTRSMMYDNSRPMIEIPLTKC